jgi:hypothetical protein
MSFYGSGKNFKRAKTKLADRLAMIRERQKEKKKIPVIDTQKASFMTMVDTLFFYEINSIDEYRIEL